MKRYLIAVLVLLPFILQAQNADSIATIKGAVKQEPKTKIIKDGDYEMKQYFFVMLTRGARRNEITDTAIINKLQAGHMQNIDRLAEMGKIMVAGPFGDNGNWRGIFIFNAETKEEVEGLLKTDPAIAAGRLDYEVHPWWTAKNCVFK